MRTGLIVGIVEASLSQHAAEAPFLWELRDGAVCGAHYNLADLAKLDTRLHAHFDGLRIGGEEAWRLAKQQLANDQGQGEVFAAGFLAFESGEVSRVADVLRIVEEQPEFEHALVSAVGWLDESTAGPFVRKLLSATSATQRRIGLAGFAVRRQNLGEFLRNAFQDDRTALKGRACKAVGELQQADLLPQVRRSLSAEDSNVRFQAAWTVALLGGDAEAVSILQSIAESRGPFREKALQMALRRLELSAAKTWQKKLSQQPGGLRFAIQAVGIIGDPELIPWLFPHMKVPPLARVAGEAFTMITGVDLAYHDLEGEWPDGFEAGPNEDPKDENVDMDPDENLPWPNPDLVQKWWEKNKGHFQNGVRYLCGKPMTIDWLKIVLRDGFQRQRAAAALELAIRQPGTPLFNVKAPGFRQIELLGKPKGPIRGPDHAG